MNIKYKQYDGVELTHELMSDGTMGEPIMMREGQRGVIVEIYTAPSLGFHVEFFDDAGDTVAVMIVEDQNLRPLRKNGYAL
jgi:hypothetical protein